MKRSHSSSKDSHVETTSTKSAKKLRRIFVRETYFDQSSSENDDYHQDDLQDDYQDVKKEETKFVLEGSSDDEESSVGDVDQYPDTESDEETQTDADSESSSERSEAYDEDFENNLSLYEASPLTDVVEDTRTVFDQLSSPISNAGSQLQDQNEGNDYERDSEDSMETDREESNSGLKLLLF